MQSIKHAINQSSKPSGNQAIKQSPSPRSSTSRIHPLSSSLSSRNADAHCTDSSNGAVSACVGSAVDARVRGTP
eukprot:7385857-Prymnesium_polylepis.1